MGTVQATEEGRDGLCVRFDGDVDFDAVNIAMKSLQSPRWRSVIGFADPVLISMAYLDGLISPPRSVHVIVDMEPTTLLDSAGLGMLVRLRNNAASFRIIRPSPQIRRLLDFSGLSDVFTVQD